MSDNEDKYIFKNNKKELKKIAYNNVVNEFFHDMICFTKPNHKHTLWNNIKDIFFTKAEKIDDSVKENCEKNIEIIFNYVYDNNLKPKKLSWNIFGHYMWLFLYRPEDSHLVKLPEEVKKFAFEQFKYKRITLKKIKKINTIVFLDEKEKIY